MKIQNAEHRAEAAELQAKATESENFLEFINGKEPKNVRWPKKNRKSAADFDDA